MKRIYADSHPPLLNPDIAAVGQELDALLVGLIELLGGEVPGRLRN
jgi:hypothetical protein